MKQIQPDLWETEVEYPAPGLQTHAYLLTRDSGNILFYNTGHRHEIEQMQALGGVAWQYLSHRDELGETLKLVRERFGAKLGGHVREQTDFARLCAPDILFEHREIHLGNVEVIPTPGHSPGSTCFLVHSPHGKRYLFTGDTLYLNEEGQWEAPFIPGYNTENDRGILAESLLTLQEIEPDIAICSGFTGKNAVQEIAPGHWPIYVESARNRLLEGA